MKTPAIFLGILALTAVHAWGDDHADQIQKVATDVQQALDARSAANPPARDALPDGARGALAQLQGALPARETAYAESALGLLTVYLDAGPARQECIDLVATLRREREATEKKTLADIETAIDRATAAVRTAKAPADLDPIVSQLGQFRMDRFEPMSSRPIMAASARANSALRFVTQWQDYLSELAAGNREQSQQALRSLSQTEIFLIPRSEILARQHEYSTTMIDAAPTPEPPGPVKPDSPAVAGIVAGIKTLDTLTPALDVLDKINRDDKDPRHAHAEAAMRSLSPLDQVYRDFRAGQSTRIELPPTSLPTPGTSYRGDRSEAVSETLSRAIQDTLLALRAQMLALALPRYLDLPPETKAKPGEGPIDFLDRVRAESLKAADYLGAARADEARTLLRTGDRAAGESSQASQFISANRLDAARQFALAVAGYEHALASGTDLIPAKVIGDRLDAIKAEHPQEFQQGFELYLSPPVRPDYPYYSPAMMRRPGMMPPFGRPPSSQPETPTLAVPAASVTPASPTPP